MIVLLSLLMERFIGIALELAADLRAEAVIALSRSSYPSQLAKTAWQGGKVDCPRDVTKINPVIDGREAAGRDMTDFINEEEALSWSTIVYRNAFIQGAGSNPGQIFLSTNQHDTFIKQVLPDFWQLSLQQIDICAS